MGDERGGGGVLVAFVLGAIAGAAVALLVAPASGEETRRRLGEKAREGRDKSREFLRQQRDGLTTAFERGKEAFDQARGPKETA
jgi:gas vesicle protein